MGACLGSDAHARMGISRLSPITFHVSRFTFHVSLPRSAGEGEELVLPVKDDGDQLGVDGVGGALHAVGGQGGGEVVGGLPVGHGRDADGRLVLFLEDELDEAGVDPVAFLFQLGGDPVRALDQQIVLHGNVLSVMLYRDDPGWGAEGQGKR